eukprot:jgi/Mesen1/1080/ME000123S00255
MFDVSELINTKDGQHKARVFNSTSVREADPLEPLRNDAGALPPIFPTARRDFCSLTPDTVAELLEHYGLSQGPQDDSLERLAKHIGIRLA